MAQSTVSQHQQEESQQKNLKVELRIPTAEDMEDMGALLFSTFAGDDASRTGIILLDGDLGAGKTALSRGFIRAATGEWNVRVTSPTYLLSNTYRCRVDQCEYEIHHMDLYRLGPNDDLTPLNLSHVFANCIALIEWPARLGADVPDDRLEVHLNIASPFDDDASGDDVPRRMLLLPHGSDWMKRMRELLDEGCVDDLLV